MPSIFKGTEDLKEENIKIVSLYLNSDSVFEIIRLLKINRMD